MSTDRPAECRQALVDGLAAGGWSLPEPAVEALLGYVNLLHQWNRAYNLTAVRDPVEMVRRHVLESIAVLPYIHGDRLLDIGSGAGLPGLPLAVARGSGSTELMDSAAKRVRFLHHVVTTLGLKDVHVVHGRAEEMPHRGADCVTARAVAPLERLLPMAIRHCAPGGRVVSLKGPRVEEELDALPEALRGQLDVKTVEVPGGERRMRIVVYHQTLTTDKYD